MIATKAINIAYTNFNTQDNEITNFLNDPQTGDIYHIQNVKEPGSSSTIYYFIYEKIESVETKNETINTTIKLTKMKQIPKVI